MRGNLSNLRKYFFQFFDIWGKSESPPNHGLRKDFPQIKYFVECSMDGSKSFSTVVSSWVEMFCEVTGFLVRFFEDKQRQLVNYCT